MYICEVYQRVHRLLSLIGCLCSQPCGLILCIKSYPKPQFCPTCCSATNSSATKSIKVRQKTKNETAPDQNEEEISANNAQEEINIGKLLNEKDDKENIQEATHEQDPGPSTSQNFSRIHLENNNYIAANNFTDNSNQGNIRKLILRKTLTMNLLTLMFGILPKKLIVIIYEK